MTLRVWQEEALAVYQECLHLGRRSMLVEATPGSGKTNLGLVIRQHQLGSFGRRRVVVVVPTRHLCSQWAQAAALVGLHLDDQFKGGRLAADFDGVVITYQQMANRPAFFGEFSRDALVIFDEIHHSGDGLSWGNALQEAFADAGFLLLLSGTPFRTDDSPIPFVQYDEDGRSLPDYVYSYGRAVEEGVCRPLAFVAYGGHVSWKENGIAFDASFADSAAELAAHRLRVAVEPVTGWIQKVLADANTMLDDIRQDHPDAAGLVVAADQEHARALADALARITGEIPAIALSDDREASGEIKRFTNSGWRRWLVSCKMVSEGVDIPRFRVGVYATTTTTRLYFRQFLGRLVRVTPGGAGGPQVAYCYLPADPRLRELAAQIEEEQRHVLQVGVEKEKRRRSLTETVWVPWEPTGSNNSGVEEVIVYGQQLPLWDVPAAMAGVVQQRVLRDQVQQYVEDRLETTRSESKQELRRQIQKLVGAYSQKSRRQHSTVYAQLNRMQSVQNQDQCTVEQLSRRVDLLRDWLR